MSWTGTVLSSTIPLFAENLSYSPTLMGHWSTLDEVGALPRLSAGHGRAQRRREGAVLSAGPGRTACVAVSFTRR